VNQYAISGTGGGTGFTAGDQVTFTYLNVNYPSNSIAFPYTLSTADVATIGAVISGLMVAYNTLPAANYPQFTEQIASGWQSSGTLLLIANTPGKQFRCNISTNSATGKIDRVASSSGTLLTLNQGPNDYAVSGNWSLGAYPVSGSVVVLDQPGAIKYNLEASSGVVFSGLAILPGFSAAGNSQLGLLQVNVDNSPYTYPEYRSTYLRANMQILTVNTDATLMRIDLQSGYAPGPVSGACLATILNTGTGTEANPNMEALALKGPNIWNTMNVLGGQVGSCVLEGEIAGFSNLLVDGGAAVRCGDGVTFTTPGLVTVNSGSLQINSAAASVIVNGGSVIVAGVGAYTTISVWANSTLAYAATGVITTLNVAGAVTISPPQATNVVVTNTNLYGAGSLTYNSHFVTLTNPAKLVGTSLQQFTLNIGINASVQTAGL
jgi:hypothetical protein